jgi:hypothetical protein
LGDIPKPLNGSSTGSNTAGAVLVFGFVLLVALIVGVPVWYAFGIDFLKVMAVSLTISILYSLIQVLEVGWFERPLLLLIFGLFLAVPVGIVFGTTGFFTVSGVFLVLAILKPFWMGDEGREQARREWKVRREVRDQEGEEQQQAWPSEAEQEAEQERPEREQETWSYESGHQDGGGDRTALARIRELRAMPYEEYLQTPHWKRRRVDVLRYAGYRCQACSRSSGPLDVHHNNYDNLGEELDRDMIVFCRECHYRHHSDRRLGR